MQLIELEVEHWRGLTGKLGPFSPTLNLICGPNESGKSRFFQALRFALFESHKGTAQHKKDLQSWTSPESPLVRLVFEVDGAQYTVTKRYLKGAYAELSGAGQTLKGSDAEERLLQLTGGRGGGSRETSEDAMGVWPLLLIAQGESRRAASEVLNPDSHSRLQDLLSDEIGTSAISTSGRLLMELATAERDRYYTPTGQERPLLKQARSRMEQAQEALDVAQDHHARQSKTAAELAEVRRQLTELTPRLESARSEAKAAKQKADAARDARSERDAKQSARDLAATRQDNAEEALNTRNTLEAELREAQTSLADKRKGLQALETLEKTLAEELAEKERAAKQAIEQRDAARARYKRAQKAEQSRQLHDRIQALTGTIQALETNQAKVKELRQKRAKMVEVTDKTLVALRKLEQDFKVSEAQLHGAAMRVGVTAHKPLSINGQALDAGGQKEILITGHEQIVLDGIADIDVRPQLGTLDEQKAKVEAAKQQLQNALEKSGLASVAVAAEAENAWTRISQEIANLEREAKLIAKQSLQDLQEELEKLKAQKAELGEVDNSIDPAAAEDAFSQAQQAVEDRQSERNAADAVLSEHRTKLAGERSTVDQLASQLESGQRKLAAMNPQDALESSLSQAQKALGEAQLALDAAKQRFEALGGEQVTDDAKRLERAASKLEQRQADTKSKLDQLQGSLRMLVEAGSYEQVQDCEAELELATAELARLERDASAAKRLHDVLSAKQQELVDRLTAPVIERIQPYLADIFPGSTLHHGDKLDFTGLQSDNIEEDFGALSGGAQEQFSLMTRIGLAEVLAGDNRLPLVLDDSLVNSDADRIRLVHRALDRASGQLQVIVFTCHEALFDALGADFHQRLSATRNTSG